MKKLAKLLLWIQGGEVDRLLGILEKADLTLEKIILTHGHLDHVGATGEMVERLDVPVEGPHEDDLFWIEALDEQSRYFNFPKVSAFFFQTVGSIRVTR